MYQYSQKGSRYAHFRADGTGRDTYIHDDPLRRFGALALETKPSILRPIHPETAKSANPRMTGLSETSHTIPNYNQRPLIPSSLPHATTQSASGRIDPPVDAPLTMTTELHTPGLGYSGHKPGRREIVGASSTRVLEEYIKAGSVTQYVNQTASQPQNGNSLPLGTDPRGRPRRPRSVELSHSPKPEYIPGYSGHVVESHATVGQRRSTRLPQPQSAADTRTLMNTRAHEVFPPLEHVGGYAGHQPHFIRQDTA